MVRPSDLPFPKNINFTFIRGAHCFGLCFCSLFYFFYSNTLSCLRLWTSIYTIVTLFLLLRVFGTLVVHPSLSFMKNECFLSSSSIMFEYV